MTLPLPPYCCKPQWATVAVFALTGVSLRLADVRAALNAKRAALYGLLSCLGLSALLAPVVLSLGPELLPQLHAEFFAGLALLCCVPTTLSTGVILARQANANDALVLLIMLLTNVLGVATLPFALAEVFGASAGAALEPLTMLEGLAYTVLAPLLAGVLARLVVPGVPWLVDKFRAYIRLAQQACLIATPWMTVRAALAPARLARACAHGLALRWMRRSASPPTSWCRSTPRRLRWLPARPLRCT